MKMTLLVFCLLFATAAFGQGYGTYISAEPQIYNPPNHPEHAAYAPISTGQTVVGGAGYTIAQGDRPASDFPQQAQLSLGDVARELRKEHEKVKKSRIVWTNQ